MTTQAWRTESLPDLAARLAARPGHETVRTAMTEILHRGLGVTVAALRQEDYRTRVKGRIDTLFAATAFEWKSDLAREMPDVQRRLPDYLRDVERETGRPALGIATDGRLYVALELRNGALTELRRLTLDPADPEALLRWLEPAVSTLESLTPTPLAIRDELGRESLTWRRAEGELARLWATLAQHPEALLKRKLWDDLLAEVYGAAVGGDALWLQHTYLTIIAKTIALHVLDMSSDDATTLLSGKALEDAGIVGAVESDFFDWVLHAGGGADLVLRLARQTERFRLHDVQQDVLKTLYESLIDPAERHDLGEYYTPDWLAAKLTRDAVTEPLTQVVLDPACGSGTFVFHAVRRLLDAAREAGWTDEKAVGAAASQIRGIDVHPVAAIIARVTWLLALGPSIRSRPATLAVPVFLGDSLQWNLREAVGARDIVVRVPDDRPITIPSGFAENQAAYDAGLSRAMEALQRGEGAPSFVASLKRLPGVTKDDAAAMAEPFTRLKALYDAGRDDIWPFVLRNLVRPLWLSRAENRADVVLGNPPWLSFRFMAPEVQARVRAASQAYGIWVGGKLATQQDLCALFWVRAAERYLKPGGTIAFLLPYAVLNRPAYKGLREGQHGRLSLHIIAAWSFDETVQPLFPVPACALIARRESGGALPAEVTRYSGALPRRDATEAEADRALRHAPSPWPKGPTLGAGSPYRKRFRQGATIVPRRFFVVEPIAHGKLGRNAAAPMVRGRVSSLDKKPWNTVEPPSGAVEAQFLRQVILGETILPFRHVEPVLGIVPIPPGERDLLDANSAQQHGYSRLATWLDETEEKWNRLSARRADGRAKVSLIQQLDHMRKLTVQFPLAERRLVYTASGTNITAARILSSSAVIEHAAYWTSVRSAGEASYLCALLNSATTVSRIKHMQARGQWGARHIDKLVWELRIPEYDNSNVLHRRLAAAAARAEKIAASVELKEGAHFTRHRATIRTALTQQGIAAEIDTLVETLLA